jgi:DNA-binding GntR family transcriptional regulator
MEDPRPHRRIYAALAARIADGTYPAGTRLNIGLLTDEFDTTRTTVGKALRLLEADGAIVIYKGMGWYVAEPPPRG